MPKYYDQDSRVEELMIEKWKSEVFDLSKLILKGNKETVRFLKKEQTIRISFYKKPVYKKPSTRVSGHL